MDSKIMHNEDLMFIIKNMHYICIELNRGIVENYALDKEPALFGYDEFEFPILAAKKKIIPRMGILKKVGKYDLVSYSIHGVGATLIVDSITEVTFKYYPKVSPKMKPILSLTSLYNFIKYNNNKSYLLDYVLIKNSLQNLFELGLLTRIYENTFEFFV